jgi:hypothetical protein
MTVPLTPKPTRKVEALTKAPPTIASRREEDVALKKWPKPSHGAGTGPFFKKKSMSREQQESIVV